MSRRVNKKRLRSKMRLAIFLVVLIGLFAGGFVAANNLLWPLFTGDGIDQVNEKGSEEEEMSFEKLDGMNVLMMGVDERNNDPSQRTDTMILANINNEDNRISLLSIPRDTKVSLPGYGVNKINAANLYGGPEMAMDIVSDLTGVKVDHYVLTNFDGFKGIVDALGGVTVDVDKDMNHNERAYGGAYSFHLKKGVQQLNGEQALGYVRYRNDPLADITRTQRQLKLLTAIGDKMMQPSIITRLHKLIPEINKNVKTNLGLKQMLAMGSAARNINNVQIVSQTLPGWFLDENGASYWYVDPASAREVTIALFKEGKVVEVVQGAMGDTGNQQVAMNQDDAEKARTEAGSVVPEPPVSEPPASELQEIQETIPTSPELDDSGSNPQNGGNGEQPRAGSPDDDQGNGETGSGQGTPPQDSGTGVSEPIVDGNNGDGDQHDGGSEHHVEIIIGQ